MPFAGIAPGFQAPTSNINFPAGLAILVIILVQVIGIREHHGIGTYKRMIQPFVFMLPLMLMDELAKPISLTFRLYGNTFGDEQVVEVLRGNLLSCDESCSLGDLSHMFMLVKPLV